jgi:hypothetical protein
MHARYSSAISQWLETILFERFGHRFALSQDQGFTHVALAGSPVTIRIVSDPTTFSQAKSDLPCSRWDGAAEGWHLPLAQSLPTPGMAQLPVPLIKKDSTGYTIGYDMMGLAYWMLSRQEEVGRTDLDEHGRFAATSSHAYIHNYLSRPIVDEWLHVLGQVINRLWPHLQLPEHRFSVRVSHDVDCASHYGSSSLKRLLRSMLGDVVKRGQFCQAAKAPGIWYRSGERLDADDPANTFDWIMDVSERHGLTSAFYFICGRTNPSLDAQYNPEDAPIRDLMRRIHARGHEIGLHPSYNTYLSPNAIVSEAKRLKRICQEESIEQAAWGGRMHYLRWNNPITLHGWEQAGMAYDSSLSYADAAGFRCGTCYEYPAFDPVAGKALNVRIRPLIAMESTVMARRYMNLGSGDAALDKFMQLADACRAVQGTFTLLWHNTLLEGPQERSLYTNLLSRTANSGNSLLQ